MNILVKREPFVLFLGDVCIFLFSLWLMLIVRYGGLPDSELFGAHLVPFALLFVAWVLVFFIAGLYEKHTVLLKSRLPGLLLNAQIVNSILAVLFFYFIPYFGITPKTSLFIYLIISFLFVLVWRIQGYAFFGARKKEKAIIIGSGEEMRELKEEVNNNSRYSLYFVSSIDSNSVSGIDFQEEIVNHIYSEEVQVIAADLRNEKVEPILPSLYSLIFSKVRFIDMHKIYEDIFDRVPLSLLKYNWFLENISATTNTTYDLLKRAMDVIIALPLLIVPALSYPFVFIAIKLEDGGPIFIRQERVGKNNQPIFILKYRTMSFDDAGKEKNVKNKVTRIGAILRKSRLDEFPQLWNVLRGDLSLIGPRPELPVLVKYYVQEVPYYNVRHIIEPGLSGWAQLYHDRHPHHAADTIETKNKLSYDLYYIKNRSFLLDLKIALKTIKALLSRSGI
jgi:exopolysaccharide biosynthesis polyprenyl glycosylphosphotransferase